MSISKFLKVIGRGSKGAKDLDREQSRQVFLEILSGKVSDLELGAFCIAMRVKGESPDELAGFMDALDPFINLFPEQSLPTIILPSYNGSRRQMNMTPLLAGLLCASGFSVIVQGIESDDTRITSFSIFNELNWPIIQNKNDFSIIGQQNQPIFCPIRILCPALNNLLSLRQRIGLRNTGHVLAKLINPTQKHAWKICNFTHPEYPEKLKKYFQLRPENAIVMRGSEGEPTASPQRLPEMAFHFLNGNIQKFPEKHFEDVVLPNDLDVNITASLTKKMLEGSQPFPKSISLQANQISKTTLDLSQL